MTNLYGNAPIIRGHNKPDRVIKGLSEVATLGNAIVDGRSKMFMADAMKELDSFSGSYDPFSSSNIGTSAADAYSEKANSLLNDSFMSKEDMESFDSYVRQNKTQFVRGVRDNVSATSKDRVRKVLYGKISEIAQQHLKSGGNYGRYTEEWASRSLFTAAEGFIPKDLPDSVRKEVMSALQADLFDAINTRRDVDAASTGLGSMKNLTTDGKGSVTGLAAGDAISRSAEQTVQARQDIRNGSSSEVRSMAAEGNKEAERAYTYTAQSRVTGSVAVGSPKELITMAAKARTFPNGEDRAPIAGIGNPAIFEFNMKSAREFGMRDTRLVNAISSVVQGKASFGENNEEILSGLGQIASTIVRNGNGFGIDSSTEPGNNSVKSHMYLMSLANDAFVNNNYETFSDALAAIRERVQNPEKFKLSMERFNKEWNKDNGGGLSLASSISKGGFLFIDGAGIEDDNTLHQAAVFMKKQALSHYIATGTSIQESMDYAKIITKNNLVEDPDTGSLKWRTPSLTVLGGDDIDSVKELDRSITREITNELASRNVLKEGEVIELDNTRDNDYVSSTGNGTLIYAVTAVDPLTKSRRPLYSNGHPMYYYVDDFGLKVMSQDLKLG